VPSANPVADPSTNSLSSRLPSPPSRPNREKTYKGLNIRMRRAISTHPPSSILHSPPPPAPHRSPALGGALSWNTFFPPLSLDHFARHAFSSTHVKCPGDRWLKNATHAAAANYLPLLRPCPIQSSPLPPVLPHPSPAFNPGSAHRVRSPSLPPSFSLFLSSLNSLSRSRRSAIYINERNRSVLPCIPERIDRFRCRLATGEN